MQNNLQAPVTGNNDLTPEEQLELESLRKEFSQQAPESGLSPKEQQELISLRSEFPSVEQALGAIKNPKDSIDQIDAVIRSGLEGATLGLSGEIGGLLQAGLDLSAGQYDMTSFAMNYRRHRDDIDKSRELAAKQWGKTAFVSELAGGMLLPGSGSVKGAMKLGAVAGFGKGEESESIVGAVEGAAFAGALGKVAELYGEPALQQMYKKATNWTKKISSAGDDTVNSFLNAIGVKNKEGIAIANDQSRTLAKKLATRNKTPEQWARETFVKPSDGKPLIEATDNAITIQRKALNEIKDAEMETGYILGKVDKIIDTNPQAGLRTNSWVNSVGIKSLSQIDDPVIAKKVLEEVKKTDGTMFLPLTDAENITNNIKGILKSSNTPRYSSLAEEIHIANEKEVANVINRISEDFTPSYIGNKEKIDNFNILFDTVANKGDDILADTESLLQPEIIDMLSKVGSRAGKIPLLTTKVVSYAIDKVVNNSGKMNLNMKKAASYNKILAKLKQNPEKYSETAVKISQAALRSKDEFMLAIAGAEAAFKLEDAPLNGTTEDLILKIPEVHTLISEANPDLGNELLKHLQSGNNAAVGQIMSQARKLPNTSKYIQDQFGYGWDGEAQTVEDMEQAKKIINESEMLNTQKMHKIEILNVKRKLPIIEPPVDIISSTAKANRDKNGKKVNDL